MRSDGAYVLGQGAALLQQLQRGVGETLGDFDVQTSKCIQVERCFILHQAEHLFA
jgi:hypothetical protein